MIHFMHAKKFHDLFRYTYFGVKISRKEKKKKKKINDKICLKSELKAQSTLFNQFIFVYVDEKR